MGVGVVKLLLIWYWLLHHSIAHITCHLAPWSKSSWMPGPCFSPSVEAEDLAKFLPSDTDGDEDYEETEDDYQPELKKSQHQKSDTIHLVVPRKNLLRQSSSLATRLNLSHRQTTAMTANFIKMGGGSMKGISLSMSTSHRHRKASVLEKATEIRSKFKQNMPDHMVLHWDGKVIKYERHHELEDRLAVVESFPGLDQNEQFLAAPRIADGKGITMSRALQATLLEWNIPLDVIIGICWDTTASNTGRHQGAATASERYTGEAKLWLACRHHVGELHIKHVDQEVRGAWNGELEVLLNMSITVATCEWMWISWILPSLTHISRDLFQLLLTGSLSSFVTDFQPLLWMWIIFDFGLGLMTIQHFHWPSLPPEP